MTDTTTAGPVAGWYDDPAGAAPYRWWDGDRWTTRTLDHAPASPTAAVSLDSSPGEAVAPPPDDVSAPVETSSAPVELVAALPDGSFPSRRSLRQATGEVPSVPAVSAAVQEAQEHAPADFTPLNPLVPVRAAEPDEPSPAALSAPGAPDDGFHAPTAWAANAPAAPAPPVAPFGYPAGYGMMPGYAPTVRSDDRNRNARLALLLPLLAMVIAGLHGGLRAEGLFSAPGAELAVSTVVLVIAVSAGVAGIPLAISGLRHAAALARAGLGARGRVPAIIGLVLCGWILLANCITFFVGFEAGLASRQNAQSSQIVTTPAPAQPAQAPDAGTPQNDNGTTDYVYNEAIAEANIKQAIVSKTHLTPTSVTCPASEPLVIGTTFDCSVNLPSGPLTAHMTVMSDQGELEISSVS